MSTDEDAIRVLHVDDEPELADLAATYLEREDDRLEIETATDAAEGIGRVADSDFDCVVSDYDMPGRNGIEFLEAVRDSHPDLPFILYTGKGSEEVAGDAIASGVTDYLQKESGTGQYAVLANRVTNAVEQFRTGQRAAELGRIRTLASEINQAIVRADSRRAAETRVCEIISESDPYRFAWIGEVDPEAGHVEPKVSAGAERGYLDGITVRTDEHPTGRGPGGTAIRERRVVVSQDIAEDEDFDPWKSDALERGFQSVAALPLGYQDTLYGLLAVYAGRPDAFDATERDLLAEIADDVAHVVHSFEVRAALREERDFIQQTVNSLNDVFYVLDTDGTFRRWNDRLVEALGYTDEEIGEMGATDLFPEGERERVAAAITETIETGEVSFEAEATTADGERVPFEIVGSTLTDRDGELEGLIGIARDLTERKRRERRLTRLIDNLPGMVYRCRNEPGWPMEDLRGEVAELTGYDPAELEGSHRYGEEVIHPDDREAVWDAIQDGIGGQEAFEITYRIRTESGETKWVWERGRATYSTDGEATVLEGFITDVTDRERHKRVVNALHETARSVMRAETAERAGEIAIETVNDVLDMPASAIHLYDESDDELVPVAWTEATRELIGTPPTFSSGEGVAWESFETGEPQIYDDLSTVPERFNQGTQIRSEIILPLDRHGVLLIGSTETDAFDDVDLSLAKTVAAHTTTALDRIEHERELKRQNERLEEFASIVSHDLRNPLNVAEGHLELSRAERDDEHLDAVARAHERIGALVDDLLELAREGADAADSEPVDIADLVAECWGNVDTAAATFDVDAESTVRADRSRLAQLLENLIRNSVEHGGDDVTVTVGDVDDGFYVADDGPGIPDDEHDRVFDSGYSTHEDGTGFGLAIVREIAEAHDCAVRLTESETGGARFEITGFERVD
ncbi:multi-sensor signal transduction histidine kinase [Halorubrum californiense DSM 19288]|uniref:histidine kinase n=1 Tax=Halorubrum californiense DSM 19288 TaxID=1227465 RepID=M0E2F5_9EURY|nr:MULTISPECIES: GAF domain-containing protein [Halorubrum]ELZ41966.1 multi-sensor signal transduction histidine kinase [Halorubrum californiense DSM 19288]TKX66589.1 PAS domain S-box protein [Halorubrum sp. GN11GM_10-3_MGM]